MILVFSARFPVVDRFHASHLMLTEGLMSVYKQAQSISKADERDFTLYALAAVGSIHHHHVTEETQYRMS